MSHVDLELGALLLAFVAGLLRLEHRLTTLEVILDAKRQMLEAMEMRLKLLEARL